MGPSLLFVHLLVVFQKLMAPHCCSSSCLSNLFWTSTPLRVNTIKGATMCVNIALNHYFTSLKNHKGSTIIWIVDFFSFLSSIPCKVSMFKTWFKLMSQKSFCKLGLCFTTHYQWQWNDKKEIRVYIWKLCYFHIYIGFKLYKILPNYHPRKNFIAKIKNVCEQFYFSLSNVHQSKRILALMIKREKKLQISEIVFTTHLKTIGSNLFLALKIMKFEDVCLAKTNSFLCCKEHGCTIYMM